MLMDDVSNSTTAQGQGGIVAVIDTANDEVIHYHDGSSQLNIDGRGQTRHIISRDVLWNRTDILC